MKASAINAQPAEMGCFTGPPSSSQLTPFIVFIGIALTFLAMGYQAFSTGGSSDKFSLGNDSFDDQVDSTGHATGPVKYNYSWFHFAFFLSAMYSK